MNRIFRSDPNPVRVQIQIVNPELFGRTKDMEPRFPFDFSSNSSSKKQAACSGYGTVPGTGWKML
jgi:hypothetical protein